MAQLNPAITAIKNPLNANPVPPLSIWQGEYNPTVPPKEEDNTNKWMFVGIVLVLIVGFYFLYKKK